MPLKNKILIVVGGGIVLLFLLLVVAYPLLFANNDQVVTDAPTETIQDRTEISALPSDTENSITPQADTLNQETFVPQAIELSDEQAQSAEIERLTRLFVERFGSYSNYSNFSNIEALESFMTPSMMSYISTTIYSQREELKAGGYYGVTTRLLRSNIEQLNLGSTAIVDISVQQEVQDGIDSEIVKKIIEGRVELLYSNNNWLIDGVYYNK